jgi:hypothetical protein
MTEKKCILVPILFQNIFPVVPVPTEQFSMFLRSAHIITMRDTLEYICVKTLILESLLGSLEALLRVHFTLEYLYHRYWNIYIDSL